MSDMVIYKPNLPEAVEYNDYISTIADLMSCDGLPVALDTETTGLNWFPGGDHIIGLGFHCDKNGKEGYIPTLTEQDRRDVYRAVNSLSKDTTIIFHNAKFDLHFLHMNPRVGGWTVMDTTIMVHLIDSRDKKNLGSVEKQYLGTSSKRGHLAAAPPRMKIWDYPLDLVSAYCTNDARVTYQLAQELMPQLREWGLEELFWKDMKFLNSVFDIEEYGVLVDVNFVNRSQRKLGDHLEIMEQNLFDACGAIFNWRSPQQLSRAIYDGLGIAKPKNPFADADGVDRSRFADSGKYKSVCTSTFLLTEKVHHPLGELISSMRETDKLRKQYQKWLELLDENNVLHTNFNLTGTRTGRLSSSKPNLQNIPSNVRGRFTQSVYTGNIERTDEYNLRKAIIARPGKVFLSVDYKQMEMRMFGILSKDPFMLASLLAGKDVHLEIALKVWGDCGYESNMVHREWSKTISFGLIYGMTLGSLMYKLNMGRPQAAKITDQYWAQFPRIKPWMNEIIATVQMQGYARYWSGRIWKEDDPSYAYKGCNALIQGGCADLLSIACMRVDEWIQNNLPDDRIVSLVHDETITEIDEGEVMMPVREISTVMQVPDLFDIPFATEPKIGRTYGSLEKVPKEQITPDVRMSYVELEKIAGWEETHLAEEPSAEELEDEEDDNEGDE